MKKLTFIILVLFTLAATAQDPMLRKMSYTDFKAKAYLIPNKANEFQAKKGIRVKFMLTMTNDGNEEYPLRAKDFLVAYYMVKANERAFPFKLEKMTQTQVCNAQLLKLRNRIETVRNMNAEEGAKYAKQFNIKGVDSRDKIMEHLRKESTKLARAKKLAGEFDSKKIVKPGATLVFSGSGFLPDTEDKKLKSVGHLALKIFNTEGKHISIPVTAVFY